MNIQAYTGYFHDGSIIHIEQTDDNIAISMDSSQFFPEGNEDNIVLSNYSTIRGKLHLKGVNKLIIDHKIAHSIKMTYDSGEILDFDIYEDKKVILLIIWTNYPPKERIDVSQLIEIEAEEMYWENIPNL